MAFNKVRSKLNRAIAAYLVSQGVGSSDNVVPANYRAPKGFPNIIVQSQISRPEAPLTGLRRVTVHIRIKGSAVQTPDDPNPGQSRVAFDELVAECYDALMQSDDGQSLRFMTTAITEAGRALATSVDETNDAANQVAANNADMTDFTCEGWYDMGEGDGEPDEEGTYWEEILIFEALASGSNTD